MRFHPNYPNDNNKGQRAVWHALKAACEGDEGVAYYRYPIFAKTRRGRSEPDFLMIHRRYGVWVVESKGFQIGHIEDIEGHDWCMRDWYRPSESPVSQVDAQAFAVRGLIDADPVLAQLRIPMEFRVALPWISRAEWKLHGFHEHPCTERVVWLQEDLATTTVREHLHRASSRHMPDMSDALWQRLLGAFRGKASDGQPRAPTDSRPASPSRIIHAVESRLSVLDEKQDRIAQEVPEGPQRLRGLAGSGKTILLARRVAQMHAAHPEWTIAFVYWSRALHQQIRDQVERCFVRLTGEAPDWDRLHLWHAWGSREQPGFYSEVARKWGCRALSLNEAKSVCGDNSPYAAAVGVLERDSEGRAPLFDAVVIDEGQDLPASFYRVAYRSLRDPKRLYWAYDEAQGVDSLVVPNAAEIFGRDADGRPRVDLSGSYPSGIQKAHNLNRCYRTPRNILTVAHAINMGLMRDGGPIQGVSSKDDWAAFGYRVIEGDFTPASVRGRADVVLERMPAATGHPADDPLFSLPMDPHELLVLHTTANEQVDVDLVVNGIARDLESGLRPEDIAVVCLGRVHVLGKIQDRLQTLNIRSLSLDNEHKDQFRADGHVTLSSIRRAKGNEAYKVYALNLHVASASECPSVEAEMVARNQVLVALTRTKLWCVASGRPGGLMGELALARSQAGLLRFPAFNQSSLKRSMIDLDGAQQDLS